MDERNRRQDVPAEARAGLALAAQVFGPALLAFHLHGSAVAGGLRPQSDVDLLAVIDRPMSDAMRRDLLAGLLRISARHPAPPGGPRCIELMVFQRADLAAPWPARAEFLYGEWLREGFEAGAVPQPVRDAELVLVLAQARQQARPLIGPAAPDLLPRIPADQIRRAMREGLPALLENLQGDERNTLLTLARMWHTAATGAFLAKDAAAEWAMPRLPAPIAALLGRARDAYLGLAPDDWRDSQAETRQAAEHLHRQVAALL